MTNWNLKGCIVPIITPFRDDMSVDEDGLRALVDFLIDEQGTDAILPCGTTGESPTLSHAEHIRVVEVVMDAVAGRRPVIAGAGSNSTAEAIELTQAVKDLGCDATLQVSPYYNRPSQAGIVKHFEAIAGAVDLPMILYNIPARTGRNIEPGTIVELAKNPLIVGLKDASGDIRQGAAVLQHTDPETFSVYSGEDALTFSLLCHGGHGAIAAVGHVIGLEVCEMCRLVFEQKVERARALHFRIIDVIDALFCEPNPAPVKQALAWMGQPAGPLRLPLLGMTEKGQAQLRAALTGLGKL